MRQKIELFQAKKEELKALYDSSRAQLQVKEAATGISKDLSDAGHAIERAETRINAMQSRVEAINNLIATGALETVREGETGFFFDAPAAQSLAEVVRQFERRRNIFDPVQIAGHVQNYKRRRFLREFSAFAGPCP